MRPLLIASVVVLGLPLGGCFGVALAPQPVPDWAMSPQAQYNEPAAAPRKHRTVRRTTPKEDVSERSALVTGEVSGTPQAAPTVSAKPFAPGWDSREEERDASLRRTMTICRGC